MSEVKLTEKDLIVLKVLEDSQYALGPTEIGLKLGISYNSASSYCNASLKRLLAAGKVVKITTDRVKYKIHH